MLLSTDSIYTVNIKPFDDTINYYFRELKPSIRENLKNQLHCMLEI